MERHSACARNEGKSVPQGTGSRSNANRLVPSPRRRQPRIRICRHKTLWLDPDRIPQLGELNEHGDVLRWGYFSASARGSWRACFPQAGRSVWAGIRRSWVRCCRGARWTFLTWCRCVLLEAESRPRNDCDMPRPNAVCRRRPCTWLSCSTRPPSAEWLTRPST